MARRKTPAATVKVPKRPSVLTTKKASGAAGRKQRKTLKAKLKKKLSAEALAEIAEDKATMEAFNRLPEVPVDAPQTGLAWLRKAQLVSLDRVLKSPRISAADKFRAVKDMADSMGRTHSKAALEEEVRRLLEKVRAIEASKGASKRVPASQVKRPPTARGQKRGPRIVKDEATATAPAVMPATSEPADPMGATCGCGHGSFAHNEEGQCTLCMAEKEIADPSPCWPKGGV